MSINRSVVANKMAPSCNRFPLSFPGSAVILAAILVGGTPSLPGGVNGCLPVYRLRRASRVPVLSFRLS